MRTLFVSVNRESVPYPVAPLGLAYVAGAARSAGHEVQLLDLCFSDCVEEDVAAVVRRFVPELIGISIRNVDNLTYPSSVSYLDEIRGSSCDSAAVLWGADCRRGARILDLPGAVAF